MPKGEHTVHPPEKTRHMQHFDLAMADALTKWKPEDGTENLKVRFEVSVSPNPGGVGTYRVIIGE